MCGAPVRARTVLRQTAGGFDGASYWARAGLAMTFKDPKAEWPVDQRPGFGDVLGGLTIAGGIAAALARRERTGTPSVVDVSLLGLGLWSIAPEVTSAKLYEGVDVPSFDRDSTPNPLVGTFPTKDGRFISAHPAAGGPLLAGPGRTSRPARPARRPALRRRHRALRESPRMHRDPADDLPHPHVRRVVRTTADT